MTKRLDLTPYLHQEEEGQFFDRKSLWHGAPGSKRPRKRVEVRDQIAEYVAAFANSDGGLLILGQEDDLTLTGFDFPSDAVEEMLAVPERRLSPSQPKGWVQEVEGHQLLVFKVPPASRAVMVIGNGFPRRVKDQVIQESEETINAIKRRGQVESYEAEGIPGLGLEDLDLVLVERAARSAGLDPSNPSGFLVERNLADLRGSELILRRAALLLFGRSLSLLDHPNAGIRIFRVDGIDRLTGSRNNVVEIKPRIEGNLSFVIGEAYQRLSLLIDSSERLHDLFFREMPEYPTFAWQEALVNAVAHRDYRDQGRGIEVWMFSDRLEVRSPGELLPSVSLESLRTRRQAHASRNPRATRILAELGLMREQGEGVPRIFEEMETSWLPMPELTLESSVFTVTLRNTPILDAGRPEWIAFVRRLPLNIRQQRIMAKNEGGSFRSGEYQSLNNLDRDQAYRELRAMVEGGYLEGPEHPGQGAIYQVKVQLKDRAQVAASESGALSPSADLRTRMGSRGFLKNLDYQECFGVARQTATKTLGALVETGVLARTEGERRYFPGPGWPTWNGSTPRGA